MLIVFQRIGEFVAHEWRFFLIIPLVAFAAYIGAFVLTPRRIMQWLVHLWPLSARLRLELGRMLFSAEPAKAEAEIQQAIRLNPEMGEAHFMLADLQLDQKDRLEDADRTVRQMLRQFPGHPAAYCLQGLVRQRRGQYAEAERSYRTANAAAPDFAWPCSLLGTLLRENLHNPLGAEIAYRQAIRNQPGNSSNYFFLGNVLMEAGRPAEAVTCYETAVQKDRRDTASRINLGLALVGAGRAAEAAKLVPGILRTQPRSAEIEVGLGRLLSKLQRRQEAQAALRRAIEKDPTLIAAYTQLAMLLDEDPCGMAEAEQVYRQGLAVNCADPNLNYDLGMLLRRLQRDREAIAYLEQVLVAEPEDYQAHIGLAAVYKLCGEAQVSAEYASKARLFIPPEEHYGLACLEAICGNAELAFEHLEQAKASAGLDLWWAWEDPDLLFVRDDPRFVEIVGPRPDAEAAPTVAEAA